MYVRRDLVKVSEPAITLLQEGLEPLHVRAGPLSRVVLSARTTQPCQNQSTVNASPRATCSSACVQNNCASDRVYACTGLPSSRWFSNLLVWLTILGIGAAAVAMFATLDSGDMLFLSGHRLPKKGTRNNAYIEYNFMRADRSNLCLKQSS
jgi:hypothetical protein